MHLSTARKHNVTLLANAKICTPAGALGTLTPRGSAKGLLEPGASLAQISNPVTRLAFRESPEHGDRGHKPSQHILVNTPALELLSKQNPRTYSHLCVWP